jgi:DNA-binding FadR family transcriptional regulator
LKVIHLPQSRHEEIADAMTRDILVGQYRTGERLPSERDLAARFDANRGAVREAMKKLEQLGLACIGPGGARVAPIEEASLDVIGHLLSISEVPDRELVAQILGVLSSLIRKAAEDAMNRVNGEELESLRVLARCLYENSLSEEEHMVARMNLMSSIMRASGNLVVHLITRSLLLQFAPRMHPLKHYGKMDLAAHRQLARDLDDAMGKRNIGAVGMTLDRMSELNRQHVMQIFTEYENARRTVTREVAAS